LLLHKLLLILQLQQATNAAELSNEKETDDLALAYGKGATGRGMATGGSKAIKELEKEQKDPPNPHDPRWLRCSPS
jgi:DNA polymerase-3 subunit delta'